MTRDEAIAAIQRAWDRHAAEAEKHAQRNLGRIPCPPPRGQDELVGVPRTAARYHATIATRRSRQNAPRQNTVRSAAAWLLRTGDAAVGLTGRGHGSLADKGGLPRRRQPPL